MAAVSPLQHVGVGAQLALVPDVGYIDFGHAGQYRELFIGGGWTFIASLHVRVIEEGLIVQALGPSSENATYLQRTKVEYDFKHVRAGGGYAAYQLGSGPWEHKPFATVTLKSSLGNFEFWLQRLPGYDAQLQVRYGIALH